MRACILLTLCTACASPDAIEGSSDASPVQTLDATLPDAAADAPPPVDAGPSDAAADSGPCGADMAFIAADGGAFCMDVFEAPNAAGVKPLYFENAPSGDAWCKAHGKRLCTEAEWDRACRGPAGDRKYPYGDGGTYSRGTCNDDKTWISPDWAVLGTYPADAAVAEAARLYQGDPSGSRVGCVTSEGVHDLTGNVAEWVVRSFPNANDYDDVMKGCYWAGCYGGSPPSCDFVNPAHPGAFRTYEAGFRCCGDAR